MEFPRTGACEAARINRSPRAERVDSNLAAGFARAGQKGLFSMHQCSSVAGSIVVHKFREIFPGWPPARFKTLWKPLGTLADAFGAAGGASAGPGCAGDSALVRIRLHFPAILIAEISGRRDFSRWRAESTKLITPNKTPSPRNIPARETSVSNQFNCAFCLRWTRALRADAWMPRAPMRPT